MKSFQILKKETLLLVEKVVSEEKETKPPARYNEASLIRELEKRGLGTKSTRADIIAILYNRKYIEGKQITVNQLGEHIIDTLREYCEQITSEELTRQFENELQEIMADKITKDEVIDEAKKEVRCYTGRYGKKQAENWSANLRSISGKQNCGSM